MNYQLFTKIGIVLLINFGFTSLSFADNLHLIEENKETGFAIYRSGEPSKADMRQYCKIGISEMAVLAGTARKFEKKYESACPSLKVIYNEKQNSRVALDRGFLNDFDQWVNTAKEQGKKIAFRCSCGCHRTGRLAAYYQMKYQGLTVAEAIAVMNRLGKNMRLHPELPPQVQALNDYIKGKPCSEQQNYCVK